MTEALSLPVTSGLHAIEPTPPFRSLLPLTDPLYQEPGSGLVFLGWRQGDLHSNPDLAPNLSAGEEMAVLFYRLMHSEDGPVFVIRSNSQNTDTQMYWTSEKTSWGEGGIPMVQIIPGLWVVLIQQALVNRTDNYEFMFIEKSRHSIPDKWMHGHYPLTKFGNVIHSRLDTRDGGPWADRDIVKNMLMSRGFETAGWLLARSLRHHYPTISLDKIWHLELLGFSRDRAIRMYGYHGMTLLLEIITLLSPSHAARIAHWDEDHFKELQQWVDRFGVDKARHAINTIRLTQISV